jgi:protease-4
MSEKQPISFGKIFWPSFLAILIVSIIGLIIFSLIIGGIVGSFGEFGPKPLAIKSNSVLHMTLKGELTDEGDTSFDPSEFKVEQQIGVMEILYGIEHAKKDSKIKGIYLELDNVSSPYSNLHEIRKALEDFKKSGKFIVAYGSGEVISQKDYYVSSIADQVFAFPGSILQLSGLGAELMFFKNSLEKLDVEVQIIRGKNNDFKSAVEPFFLDKMSDSSRLQTQTYMNSMWATIREDICTSRKITPIKLNNIADSLLIRRAADARKYNLIDGIKYKDEVEALIAKKLNLEEDEKINFMDFNKYAYKKFIRNQTLTKNDKPNVAVILAEGEISTTGNEGITPEKLIGLLRDAKKNPTVKTIVLRINSPGGSALASEEIWREISLVNKIKPVIVSMGSVAASGGYYLATGGSYIFAEPTTITGSIGVFGMIPYTGNMFQNKLGITFDQVATNQHAVMSMNKRLTPEDYQIIQEEVDEIYSLFLTRVATNRKLDSLQVNAIARGRVWTGRDALTINLVDKLGGLTDAIAYAAKQVGISDIRTLYYPLKKEDKFLALLQEFEEETSNVQFTELKLPAELKTAYNFLTQLSSKSRIQMRMPVDITIH